MKDQVKEHTKKSVKHKHDISPARKGSNVNEYNKFFSSPDNLTDLILNNDYNSSANNSLKGSSINNLQQTHGNKFLNGIIQAKLNISQPEDKYEQEADRSAKRIMSMPQSQCVRFERYSGNGIQINHVAVQPPLKEHRLDPSFASDISNSSTSGLPIPDNTRSFMEQRFGEDFSDVRIHRSSNSNRLNNEFNSIAFTYGNNIYFKNDTSNFQTYNGRILLAHELVHTIQQRKSKSISLQQSNFEESNIIQIKETPEKKLRLSDNNVVNSVNDLLMLVEKNFGSKFKYKVLKTSILKDKPLTTWLRHDFDLEGTIFGSVVGEDPIIRTEFDAQGGTKVRADLTNLLNLNWLESSDAYIQKGSSDVGGGTRVRTKINLFQGDFLSEWEVNVRPEIAIEGIYDFEKGLKKPIVAKARIECKRYFENDSGQKYEIGFELDFIFRLSINPLQLAKVALTKASQHVALYAGTEASVLGTIAVVAETGLFAVALSVPLIAIYEITVGKEKTKNAANEIMFRNRSFAYKIAEYVYPEAASSHIEAFKLLFERNETAYQYAKKGEWEAIILWHSDIEGRNEFLQLVASIKTFKELWDEITRILNKRQFGWKSEPLPDRLKNVIQ